MGLGHDCATIVAHTTVTGNPARMEAKMLDVNIGKALLLSFDDETVEKLLSFPTVKDHILCIGLRNILMDAHSACKAEDYPNDEIGWRNASKAMAEKKLAAMLTGVARSNSGTTVVRLPSDPVGAEAMREARVFYGKRTMGWEKNKAEPRAFIAALGAALELPFTAPNEVKALIAQAIARRAAKPENIERARVIVAENVKVAAPTAADLGL